MQAEELDDERVSVVLEVFIVASKDVLEIMKLRPADRLQSELCIRGVVEERAALARARELAETVEPTLHEREELIRPDRSQI